VVVVVVVVVVVITEMLTLYHCIVAGSEDSSTMSKSFRLADVERTSLSTSQHLTTTDWTLCLLCHEDKTETLTKLDQSKRKDIGSRYSSLAENVVKFSELGELPGSFHLE